MATVEKKSGKLIFKDTAKATTNVTIKADTTDENAQAMANAIKGLLVDTNTVQKRTTTSVTTDLE